MCSRILKIAYPTGKVLNVYGEKYKPGFPEMKNGLFCGQHACNLSKDGYLYVFNNNVRDSACLPEIVMMKEPTSEKDTLKRIWQYSCTLDGINVKKSSALSFQTGGNVLELPDGSMFVTMSQPYCKVFIVSHDKKILWSALPEKREQSDNVWKISGLYRASIIYDHKDMERLI